MGNGGSGLRRPARGGRVPAPDHREAPAAAGAGAGRRPARCSPRSATTATSRGLRRRAPAAGAPRATAPWRISTSRPRANVNRALRRARELGLLTIGFCGPRRRRDGRARATSASSCRAGQHPPHPGGAHRSCSTCCGTRCTSRWGRTMSSEAAARDRLVAAAACRSSTPSASCSATAAAAGSPPS